MNGGDAPLRKEDRIEKHHGPFVKKRWEKVGPRSQRVVFQLPDGTDPRYVSEQSIDEGGCPCRLCEADGPNGMPGSYTYVRDDRERLWIVTGLGGTP